jgi:hypothetical protein
MNFKRRKGLLRSLLLAVSVTAPEGSKLEVEKVRNLKSGMVS